MPLATSAMGQQMSVSFKKATVKTRLAAGSASITRSTSTPSVIVESAMPIGNHFKKTQCFVT